MAYPSKPILESTDTEFLLFIHPSERDRAKSIEQYRWDSTRKCWVYPKTRSIFNGLISEFEGNLGLSKSEKRPAFVSPESLLQELKIENKILKTEIKKLRDDSDGLQESASKKTSKESVFKKRYNEQSRELLEAQKILREIQEDLHDSKQQLLKAKTQIETHELNQKSQVSGQSLAGSLQEVAHESTGHEKKFGLVLAHLKIDQTLPLILAKEVEKELRSLLGIDRGDTGYDLNGLIREAADTELISRDAKFLAHMIRVQRNILAHRDEYEKTYQARVYLSLFAACLLWPEFPE